MTQLTINLEGKISPNQQSTYLHLPFEVPVNSVRLEVEYRYSDQISSDPLISGGNTIDLGIFDERGTGFLSAGFRGWSGSNRMTFFITETDATPGYLPGTLKPGQWNILLGLYKIAPQGCIYQVKATIETQESHQPMITSLMTAGDLPATLPRAPYAPWLRGELHCHTWHSDGELSASSLIKLACARGMDFLAIADHNTIASQIEQQTLSDPGMVLVRGVEATTFKGHFNIWGVLEWVDFRVQSPEDMRAAIEYAKNLGALTSCNHPQLFGPPWDYPEVNNFHCVEVWNGPWSGLCEMALEYWVSLLETGRRVPAVGGSDFHNANEGERNIGTPTNWVYLTGTPTADGILQAIQQGHVALSDVPDGPLLDLRAGKVMDLLAGDIIQSSPQEDTPIQIRCLRGSGCLLQVFDQRGVLLEQAVPDDDFTYSWTLSDQNSRYIRAELRAESGRLRALTNPLYIA